MITRGLTSCTVIITARPTDAIKALFKENSASNAINLDEVTKHARSMFLKEELHDESFESLRETLEKENAPPLRVQLLAHLGRTLGIPVASKYVDYDPIYRRLFADLTARTLWLRDVLYCVAFAKRPLTVSELASALGIEHGMPDGSQQSLQGIRVLAPKQLKNDLESMLGVLIRIKDNVIHLIHNTLWQFIRQNPDTFSRTESQTPRSNGVIAPKSFLLQKCLLLLSIPELRHIEDIDVRRRPFDTICDPPVAEQPHSFLSYAARCWPLHMVDVTDDDDQQTKDCFSNFWENGDSRTWWAGTLTLKPWSTSDSRLEALYTALELVSSPGKVLVVKSLVSKIADSLSVSPALFKALVQDDREIANLCRHNPVDKDDDLWAVAFKEACSYGNCNLVSALLAWTTERSQEPYPLSPLVLNGLRSAAENGHWLLISQIFQSFSNLNTFLDEGQFEELLLEASKFGRDGVVDQLLKFDPSRNKFSSTGPDNQGMEKNAEDSIATDESKSEEPRTKETTAPEGLREDTVEAADKREAHPPEKEQSLQEPTDKSSSSRRCFNEALVEAAKFGSLAVVEILLPLSDLKYKSDVDDYSSLQWNALQFSASGKYP